MNIFRAISQSIVRGFSRLARRDGETSANVQPEAPSSYNPRLFLGKSGGFEATSNQRLYPNLGSKLPINDELRASIEGLRGIGRDQEQNNPYGKRYLRLSTTNVIGRDGVKLRCQFTDKNKNLLEDINDEIETAWSRWGKKGTCDVTGKFSFVKIQELSYMALKRDGEIFVRLIKGWERNDFGFAIQLIMADRLDHTLYGTLDNGRTISLGIEFDEYGAAIAYYFTDINGSNYFPGRKHRRIDAAQILHIFDPTRPDAQRGYSHFSTSVNKLRMLHGFDEAELTQKRIEAAKMGWLVKKELERGGSLMQAEDDDSSSHDLVFEVEPGVVNQLPPGYDIKETTWGNHEGNPADFRKGQLRGAAAGLNVNYNDMAMDYEGVNYTSLRAAYLSDRDGYAVDQRIIMEDLCQPVYEAFLPMAILMGQIKTVKATEFEKYMEPIWSPRGWKWVDPLKEAKGYEIMLDRGLISEDEIVSERGAELEEIYLKKLAAKQLRERLGLDEEEKGETKADENGRSKKGASAKVNPRAFGATERDDSAEV